VATSKKTNHRVARRQGRPHAAAAKVGREALVSTTREMLRTVSPSRITLTEIARYAGVDRALIRYYFGNKERLLIAATMEVWDELRTLSRISFSASDTVEDKLSSFARVLMHFLSENPFFHQLMMDLVLSGKDKKSRNEGEKIVADRIQEFGDWLTADGDTARNVIDARFLFIALIGMCEQFFSSKSLVAAVFGKEMQNPELIGAYTDFVERMVVRMLRADASDSASSARPSARPGMVAAKR
jgi:AcrR family transcriptional regulator